MFAPKQTEVLRTWFFRQSGAGFLSSLVEACARTCKVKTVEIIFCFGNSGVVVH